MCQELELCNGAFTASLVKGKWQYTPNMKKVGKKKAYEGSEKEKPQFEVINEIENEAVEGFREAIKQTVLDVAKFLKKQL